MFVGDVIQAMNKKLKMTIHFAQQKSSLGLVGPPDQLKKLLPKLFNLCFQ
jgi:hypothetical protein